MIKNLIVAIHLLRTSFLLTSDNISVFYSFARKRLVISVSFVLNA